MFAIAITLLILEIRIPHIADGGESVNLAKALLHLWPSYFAYLLSFLIIGIYWANHHYLFKLFKRTDHMLNLMNLIFLLCISFLPFPTSILGEYMQSEKNQVLASAFYAFGLLMPATAWLMLWLYGSKKIGVIDENLDPKFLRFMNGQFMISVLVYLVAIGVTFLNFIWGLGICVTITLLYLLPPVRPKYMGESKILTPGDEKAI